MFDGGCLCGAVRLKVDVTNARMIDCHCADCQKTSGGGPSHLIGVPISAFSVTRGSAAGHTVTGSSGKPVTRFFCKNCGSPLYSEPEAFSEFIFVKVGALDSDPNYKPVVAVWTDSAPSWHRISDTITKRSRG